LKIHIKNFQSLRDVSLDVRGFTVITGKSNIGKSAIVRAVQGALTNTKGNYFIRNGEKSCEVALSNEKVSILWNKGEGNNYTIAGKDYRNVGFQLPPDIAALGFKGVAENIFPQIADQFKPLFLIDETGSTCADVLFDVSRINVLNEVQRLIERDAKNASTTLKLKKIDLDRTETALAKFHGFETVRNEYESLRDYSQQLSKIRVELSSIQELFGNFRTHGLRVKALMGVTSVTIPAWDEAVVVEFCEISKAWHEMLWLTQSIEQNCIETITIGPVPALNFTEISELEAGHAQIKRLTESTRHDLPLVPPEPLLDFLEIGALQDMTRNHARLTASIRGLSHDFEDISLDLGEDIASITGLNRAYTALAQYTTMTARFDALTTEITAVNAEIDTIRTTLKVCPLCESEIHV
jgi:energy-coupling factor transporter ATP-binding protein EcfA2